jgi:hypothetical protein
MIVINYVSMSVMLMFRIYWINHASDAGILFGIPCPTTVHPQPSIFDPSAKDDGSAVYFGPDKHRSVNGLRRDDQ